MKTHEVIMIRDFRILKNLVVSLLGWMEGLNSNHHAKPLPKNWHIASSYDLYSISISNIFSIKNYVISYQTVTFGIKKFFRQVLLSFAVIITYLASQNKNWECPGRPILPKKIITSKIGKMEIFCIFTIIHFSVVNNLENCWKRRLYVYLIISDVFFTRMVKLMKNREISKFPLLPKKNIWSLISRKRLNQSSRDYPRKYL